MQIKLFPPEDPRRDPWVLTLLIVATVGLGTAVGGATSSQWELTALGAVVGIPAAGLFVLRVVRYYRRSRSDS